MNYSQYEVVLVNTRPCLIISPKEMNFDNLIVAPMTSTNKDYPTRVKLKNDSFVVLDQIRTISVKRVVKKLDIKLSPKHIKEVKSIIKIMLVD